MNAYSRKSYHKLKKLHEQGKSSLSDFVCRVCGKECKGSERRHNYGKICPACVNAESLERYYRRMQRPHSAQKLKEQWVGYKRTAINECKPSYIRAELIRHYGFTSEDITPELIDVQRKKLEIWRMIKRLRGQNKLDQK
jgi:hypothetical protein